MKTLAEFFPNLFCKKYLNTFYGLLLCSLTATQLFAPDATTAKANRMPEANTKKGWTTAQKVKAGVVLGTGVVVGLYIWLRNRNQPEPVAAEEETGEFVEYESEAGEAGEIFAEAEYIHGEAIADMREVLEASSTASSSKSTCCICMERPSEMVLVPCGHLAMCQACTTQTLQARPCCPVCRREVERSVRVFYV